MDTEKDEKKVVREWAKWNNVVSYFTVAAIPIGLSAVAVGSIFVYHCLTPKPAAPKSPTTYSAGLNAAKQSASQTTPPADRKVKLQHRQRAHRSPMGTGTRAKIRYSTIRTDWRSSTKRQVAAR